MKKGWIIAGSLLLVVIFGLLDYFFPGRHEGHQFWWSHIPAFFLLFGFAGCMVLVLVPKFIAHHWLDRKEDYYDD